MSPRARVLTAIVLLIGAAAALGWWLNRPAVIDGHAPTAATAVIMIPGYGGGAGGLEPLASALRATGRIVEVTDIGDGHGDIAAYGAQVADRARALVAAGAPAVDLVGYSEGGLIARAAVAADPSVIGRVATIGSPHSGTALAGLGAMLGNEATCPLACQQMAPDSDFLGALPQAGDAERWLSVYSATDDVIRPADSSDLAGATNIEVTGTCTTGPLTHGAVVTAAATAALVTSFLATGQATCSP